MADARFRDADPVPLALRAQDDQDLQIVSALIQDAVLPVGEISYDARRRRLALLLNRFRWESAEGAKRDRRPFERVRALLVISDVTGVQSAGIDRHDPAAALELLSLTWEPGADGTGRLLLQFAGGGTIAAHAECLNLDLRDVTRPYNAPSGRMPHHPL